MHVMRREVDWMYELNVLYEHVALEWDGIRRSQRTKQQQQHPSDRSG